MSDNCNCYPEKPTIKLPIQSIGFPCQGMSIDIDASAIEQCHCTLASPVQQGQVPEGGLIKQVYQVSEDGKRYEFRELPLATETESGLALRLATNSEVKLGDGKGLVSAEQLAFLLTKLEELEEQDRKLEEQDRQLQAKDEQLEERDRQLEEQDRQLEEQDRHLEEQNRQLEERTQKLEVFSSQLLYPGIFRNFYEKTPFSGWAVRDGAVLENADEAYPELWAALQKPENAWKVKTLAEWTALSTTAGGVGGVPFFVLNASTKTIKLPDTRGDYERGVGSSYLSAVGGWHGDAMQAFEIATELISSGAHISGRSGSTARGSMSGTTNFVEGGFNDCMKVPVVRGTGGSDGTFIPIRTASENRTRAFGVLPCVYIGGI